MKKLIASILAGLLLSGPGGLQAGMLDDWIAATSSSSGGYFEGQKRNYLFGGSYSARWPTSTDYPITIQTPRLSIGCGGIDAFLGGFSFLGFDYLVDKLQAMIMNAPAIAFDLALNAMTQQLSSSMKSFEGIINTLNSMSMNECEGARSLLALRGLDERAESFGILTGEKIAEATSLQKIDQGVEDFRQSVYRRIQSNSTINPADVQAVVEGCSDDIKSIFLGNHTGGYLLDMLGQSMGIPNNYTDLMRGMVGDVRVGAAAEGYKVTLVESCSENNQSDVEAFINGQIFARRASDLACGIIPDVDRNFVEYARGALNKVGAAILTKTPVTANTVGTPAMNLIDNSPVPIYAAMKTAVATGQEVAVANQLADLVAKAMAMRLMKDFHDRVSFMLTKGQIVFSANTEAIANDASSCQIQVIGDEMPKGLEYIQKRVDLAQQALALSYSASIQQAKATMGYLDVFRATNQELEQELTKRFSNSLAQRVM